MADLRNPVCHKAANTNAALLHPPEGGVTAGISV